MTGEISVIIVWRSPILDPWTVGWAQKVEANEKQSQHGSTGQIHSFLITVQ